MGWNFSGSSAFGLKKSKSKTSPWSVQAPYLQAGFEGAQERLDQGPNLYQQYAPQFGTAVSQQAGPLAALMQQYGQSLMPSIGQAQGFYGDVMSGAAGQFTNPYESAQYQDILSNYWGAPQQMQADALRADTVEGLRRSDWGDALGASLAGVGVGAESSPYMRARLQSEENALRGYQGQLAGLHDRAFGQALGRAGQWAGADMQNQQLGLGNRMAAAGNLMGAGMQGAQLMQGGYGLAQQGAQDYGGWGDYMANAEWAPLQNYWNVVGSNSWGSSTKSSEQSLDLKASGGWG